jgi:rubrerythrin
MTDVTPERGATIWQRGPQTNWLPLASPYNPPLPDLYAHLAGHVEAERGLLDDYSAAARKSPSKALGYLINILIEDEVRHHRIFAELLESVKAKEKQWEEGHWSEGDTVIPHNDFYQSNHGDENAVIDLTERLIEMEQQDGRELKRLQRELRDVKDTTLWSLLVDLMEHDTRKHIAILRFAKKHAGRRKR